MCLLRNIHFSKNSSWLANKERLNNKVQKLDLMSVSDKESLIAIVRQLLGEEVPEQLIHDEYHKVLNEFIYYTSAGLVSGLTITNRGEPDDEHDVSIISSHTIMIRNRGEQSRLGGPLWGSMVNPLGMTDILYNLGLNPLIAETRETSKNHIICAGFPTVDEPA
jgi:hypothetical protein